MPPVISKQSNEIALMKYIDAVNQNNWAKYYS
jgi:hypothetical protein